MKKPKRDRITRTIFVTPSILRKTKHHHVLLHSMNKILCDIQTSACVCVCVCENMRVCVNVLHEIRIYMC